MGSTMNPQKPNSDSPEAHGPQGAATGATQPPGTSWETDLNQTLKLGEQFVGFAGGVIDLARTEALLALNSLPKLMMLWLIMMPIILLTWCSFSVLAAWALVAVTGELGWGILTFFLLQLLLLLVCRVLFVKYRTRMTFPYTRAQVDNFMRSTKYELKRRSETQE